MSLNSVPTKFSDKIFLGGKILFSLQIHGTLWKAALIYQEGLLHLTSIRHQFQKKIYLRGCIPPSHEFSSDF